MAWQWYTDLRRQSEGKPRRKDCVSLLSHPHRAVHFSADKIAEMARAWEFFNPATPEDAIALINRGEPEA